MCGKNTTAAKCAGSVWLKFSGSEDRVGAGARERESETPTPRQPDSFTQPDAQRVTPVSFSDTKTQFETD